MKVKRSLFVIALIALFAVCYVVMNKHYDELARYPHELTQAERSLVLEHLNTEEINMLISRKIEPDQFLPYIETEGFELEHTLWYDRTFRSQKEGQTKEFIIRFINKYKAYLQYGEVESLLNNYSFNVMIRFFDEGDAYVKDAKLIANPSDRYTRISAKQTLYTYEPSELVSIGSIPHTSIIDGANDILVKQEVLEPLQQLCAAAGEINQKPYGDMQVVAGYISYEDQINLYERATTKYEDKKLSSYWDVPGQSEYQLGYTVQLLPNEMQADVTNRVMEESMEVPEVPEEPSEGEREQEIWLKDNAYKYGFVIRYTKAKEEVSGKIYQPYTLRYVGKEMAKDMHDKDVSLEEVNLANYK